MIGVRENTLYIKVMLLQLWLYYDRLCFEAIDTPFNLYKLKKT